MNFVFCSVFKILVAVVISTNKSARLDVANSVELSDIVLEANSGKIAERSDQ